MKRKNVSSQTEELKVQLARALADYDNLKKRVEKEKEEVVRYANQQLIEEILPSIELLERVYVHSGDPGVAGVLSSLKEVLRENGVLVIKPAAGEKFDEQRHEAVETVSSSSTDREGMIAEVVNTGYVWADGKLIVPAKVKVYGEDTEKKKELKKETMRGDYV